MDKTLRRGSVTVTESSVVITFSKEAPATGPIGKIGYDLNEKSIVGSDGSRYDLTEVAGCPLSTESGALGSMRNILTTND